MQKMGGWICDNTKCRKFFTKDPLIVHGKKRELHFCSLKCKGTYLKKIGKINNDSTEIKNQWTLI